MRNRIKLLVSFILAFLLVGNWIGTMNAAAEDAGADIIGLWKLSEMKTSEEVVTPEALKSYEAAGMVIYLDVRKDGTIKYSSFGDDVQGTWDKKKGTVTMEDSKVSYTLEQDILTLHNDNGETMKFRRTTMEELDAIRGYMDGVLDKNAKYFDYKATFISSDNVSLSVTGFRADKTGFNVDLSCINKKHHPILVSVDKCFVNKYAIDPAWAVSLDSKETTESSMVFKPADLKKAGISVVDEILMEVKVIDSEDWEVLEEGIQVGVYPTEKTAEEIAVAARTPVANETVVLDNANCTFAIQGVEPNDPIGYAIDCYVENKTDQPLTFMWNGETLNDKPVVSLYADVLLPGTRSYSKVYFMSDTLQENSINPAEVKKAAGTLQVYSNQTETPALIAEQAFTYTVAP
ncbi:MAG: hypothetical protein Q4F43_08220 [Eubacteriales bacterium]|nr:hypothetical protein [Eubacteriales bacterium]